MDKICWIYVVVHAIAVLAGLVIKAGLVQVCSAAIITKPINVVSVASGIGMIIGVYGLIICLAIAVLAGLIVSASLIQIISVSIIIKPINAVVVALGVRVCIIVVIVLINIYRTAG